MCKYVILPLSYVCVEASVGSALDFWEGKTTVEWSSDNLEDHLRSLSLTKKVTS